MKISKRAMVNQAAIEKYIIVILLAVVLLKVLAGLFPIASEAGTELNGSGFPLGEFFLSNGIVWLILAAGLILLFVRSFMKSK